MSNAGNSKEVILFALLANLGIAGAKFGGAVFSGSASMLAEAIHSLVDTANQALLLMGQSQAKKPPSTSHPLGYSREAFFWSFVVALLLFSLGGLFAIYEGCHKIENLEPISSPMVAFCILGMSLVLEAISFKKCIDEVKKQNPYGNLWVWFKKTTSSDLLVVFTEDAAALAGLGVATLCLLASWITNNPFWDALGSILVGSLLVIVAILLATEIKSLMIGEAPSTDFQPFLDRTVDQHVPGSQILRVLALQIGTDEVLLSYKISPGRVKNVDELVSGINSLEKAVRQEFPQVRWQFVEPDYEA